MIVGYGICGGGESKRYMKETLEEFKRLCDQVIILGNNITEAERKLVKSYKFELVEDNREWGKLQWKIKQDFLERYVSKLVRDKDMLVCLDMDEVFCEHLTKEWLERAPLDAYHVFVVDLWNDREHYRPDSCFWNVRIWRWNGQTSFKQKPVHCGLAPQWAYYYHRYAPFVLRHYGLMKKEDRMAKIARYDKYDPSAQFLERKFYDMLKSDSAKTLNEAEICRKIETEVATYKQVAPKPKEIKPAIRYAYVKNPSGRVYDIPEGNLAETLKRKGFTFLNWVDHEPGNIDDVIPVEADPYECAICGFIGKTQQEVIKHKREKHK